MTTFAAMEEIKFDYIDDDMLMLTPSRHFFRRHNGCLSEICL